MEVSLRGGEPICRGTWCASAEWRTVVSDGRLLWRPDRGRVARYFGSRQISRVEGLNADSAGTPGAP